ncbi:MAG: hypothetical protein M3357_05390 [Actinomycetota bacterium]|nr:hypothetical protein [Actinomycetota bacterium]
METPDNNTTAGREPRPAEPELELPEPDSELPQPELELRDAELEIPPVQAQRRERPQGMVPGRERRRTKVERASMRVLATGGIIGIDVILGAVLVDQGVEGWIVGLVVGLTSVILAAVLWSSRQL